MEEVDNTIHMNMTNPTIRYYKIDCGIGKQLPISIVAEIYKKRATHVSFHSNNIHSLDIVCSPQQSNRKKTEEEAIICSGDTCLEHLIELDLSSNCLHMGHALPPCLNVPKKVSLLRLCSNLLTLNLASNGLNEQSFGNMMDGCSSGEVVGTSSFLLPRLHTLDISHNNFTMLPRLLHNLCPSLKHLAAVNNKIKSLTSLLQELHTFRGKLESLQLMEDTTTSSTTNLVCSKEFYREKIIFLLGTQFVRLDGGKISNTERENARLKLEQGLSIHPGYTTEEPKVKENTLTTSGEKQRMQQHTKVELIDHGEVEDEETQKKITTLEAHVASLSATIENYLSSTTICDVPRCRNEGGPVVDADDAKLSKIDKSESQHSGMRKREIVAASSFLLAIFRKRQHLSQSYFAFSLWRLSTRFDRHAKLSKVRQVESERTWAKRSKELVNQAVSDETEKCKRLLDQSREAIQKSEERISQLTREVEDLEERLQNERRSQRKSEVIFNETSDAMMSEMHRLEAKLRKQISDNKENIRQSENELNTLREKLHMQSESVAGERRSRTIVEAKNKNLTMAYDEAKLQMAKGAALLDQLKLEVVSKDVSAYKSSVAIEASSSSTALISHHLLRRKQSNRSKTRMNMQHYDPQRIGRDVNKLLQQSKMRKICFNNRQSSCSTWKLRPVVMLRIISRGIHPSFQD